MYVKLVIIVFFIFTAFAALAGKKQCKPYLEKLHNIQSLQKMGHSNKRGRSLATREAKAREIWWKCEKGKLPKKSKKKARKVKSTKRLIKSTPVDYSYSTSLTNKITISSPFEGAQQQAWLDFYQQPKECKKPKSIKQFAFCMENRQEQQSLFKQQLGKKSVN